MLTEKRKADRQKMAEGVKALCEEMGASCEIKPGLGSREIRLNIEMGECRVGIDFDGESNQPDVICMPWNTLLSSDARMTPAFGRAVVAEVNPFHRAKCMGFAHGYEDLIDRLRAALECIKAGDAYVLDPQEYRFDFDRLSGTGILVRLADDKTSLRYTGDDALWLSRGNQATLKRAAEGVEFT